MILAPHTVFTKTFSGFSERSSKQIWIVVCFQRRRVRHVLPRKVPGNILNGPGIDQASGAYPRRAPDDPPKGPGGGAPEGRISRFFAIRKCLHSRNPFNNVRLAASPTWRSGESGCLGMSCTTPVSDNTSNYPGFRRATAFR